MSIVNYNRKFFSEVCIWGLVGICLRVWILRTLHHIMLHGEGEKVFCDTLTLRMYERTLPIRATCELVQKQGTLVTLSR